MPKEIEAMTPETASTEAKPVLEQVEKDLGFVPNLFGVFANNPEVLKSYLHLSKSFESAGFSPTEQQIVLITISRENSCDYCVAAHTAISAMSKLDEQIISKLRKGQALEDKKLEALRSFTKRVVSAKGWIDPSDLSAFLTAGYTSSHALAVILGLSMKTLSNYVNHIAGTELDEAFNEFRWTRT